MTTVLSDLFEWAKDLVRILYFSITSPGFYQDVFTKYKGYGAKYLLTISMICSCFVSAVILNTAGALNEYFVDGKISSKVIILDHIINQFPVLEYNGKTISTTDNTPIILNTISNQPVVIIDPDNKVPYNKKSKVPIYLDSKQVNLSLISSDGEVVRSLPLDYQAILGSEKVTINQDFVRTSMINIVDRAPVLIIFAIFPILSILFFSNIVLQDLISIFILTALLYFYKSKLYMQNCIRVVFFASGITLLLQVLTSILVPDLLEAVKIVELWVNFLLVVGLFRMLSSKNNNNSIF